MCFFQVKFSSIIQIPRKDVDSTDSKTDSLTDSTGVNRL